MTKEKIKKIYKQQEINHTKNGIIGRLLEFEILFDRIENSIIKIIILTGKLEFKHLLGKVEDFHEKSYILLKEIKEVINE